MKLSKHKTVLTTIIVLCTALLIGFIFMVTRQPQLGTQPQVITGKVAGTSNECNVDGICSIILDNDKRIITGCGLSAGGKTCKRYDQSRLRIGQRVEATVMYQENTTYNLECATCTIRPLD